MRYPLLLIGVLTIGCTSSPPSQSGSQDAGKSSGRDPAIVTLEQAGAAVIEDKKDPAHPVLIVDLTRRGTSDETLAHLAGLKGTLHVVARENPRITDAGMVRLENLDTIVKLDLSKTTISDDGLVHVAKLPRLEDLDLTKTRITDAGLDHLKKLPRLRRLVLDDTGITNAAVPKLRAMKELEELHVNGVMIDDGASRGFILFPKLRRLAILSTDISEREQEYLMRHLPVRVKLER